MDVVIEARGLYVTYPGNVPGLRGVDLRVAPGERVCLLGRSGSGKTTLLSALLGAVPVASGELTVLGVDLVRARPQDIQALRRRVGVVFQNFRLFRGRTAYDNVALSLRTVGVGGAELRRRTLAALEAVGLGSLAGRRVETLSWGQQQRVAIARALVRRPELLLADEPTGNLDAETAGVIADLLASARDHGATVLVATHDPAVAERLAGRAVMLGGGRVVRDGVPEAAEGRGRAWRGTT